MHDELRDRRQILTARVDRRAQAERVGPADRDQRLVVEPAHPGDDRAVVEPDHELHAHVDAPLHALDDAHDVRFRLAWRHEVDYPDTACRRLPFRLEHECPLAIAALGAGAAVDRRDQPASVVARPEQRREARAGVETRKAEPVHRARAADERRSLQVAEERVVLDPLGHGENLRGPADAMRASTRAVCPYGGRERPF